MCKVISVANQKGGVGKTAVSVNLSASLCKKGYKVLLVDMDSQGSATASLGYKEPDGMDETISDVYRMLINDDDFSPSFGIRKTSEKVDLMPGNIELAAVEVGLVNVMNRERILTDYISMERPFYDFIIIDCCPSLGMLAINALSASDSVIIPVQPSYLPVKGLGQLFKTIYKVKKQINPDLHIEGVLLNMVDARTNYAKEIINKIHEAYEGSIRIFDTYIPLSVKVGEATAEGVSVLSHDPKGKAAMSYTKLTEEVLS